MFELLPVPSPAFGGLGLMLDPKPEIWGWISLGCIRNGIQPHQRERNSLASNHFGNLEVLGRGAWGANSVFRGCWEGVPAPGHAGRGCRGDEVTRRGCPCIASVPTLGCWGFVPQELLSLSLIPISGSPGWFLEEPPGLPQPTEHGLPHLSQGISPPISFWTPIISHFPVLF